MRHRGRKRVATRRQARGEEGGAGAADHFCGGEASLVGCFLLGLGLALLYLQPLFPAHPSLSVRLSGRATTAIARRARPQKATEGSEAIL